MKFPGSLLKYIIGNYALSYRPISRDAQPAALKLVITDPQSRIKKYKKLLLNDKDFMNEFKLQ